MRKLTEEEVNELRAFKYEENGDELYWNKLAEIYSDDQDALEKIHFMKNYLLSVRAIPLTFQSHDKTVRTYLESVDAFNSEIGYTPEPHDQVMVDNFLEKIAAKFGINIDINGDGITSFDRYGNNN